MLDVIIEAHGEEALAHRPEHVTFLKLEQYRNPWGTPYGGHPLRSLYPAYLDGLISCAIRCCYCLIN